MSLSRLLITLASILFFLSANVFSVNMDFKTETKFHYRNSENVRFATQFPPDSAHETVDGGSHFEVSNIALMLNIDVNDKWTLRSKVDIIDLYEKNPSSSDLDISLDKFILRYGNKTFMLSPKEKISWYAQIGKFGKFERQEDRHLESYGLVSTAFNRLEDSGLEIGLSFAAGAYAIFSYTTGNPVFFRDPNALAGDNGVRDPEYKPGLLILYDAEVEEFNLGDTPETGIAGGFRWGNSGHDSLLNIMLFGYQRDLDETKELHGTRYGGDLDFFEFSELFTPGPIDPANDLSSIPLSDTDKSEVGINIWWYHKSFALFSQHVEQSIGGLDRNGSELELSYALKANALHWLEKIEPVVRYSVLSNDFTTPPNNPSPSIAWDWKKLDIGFNLHFSKQSFVSLEYAVNRFKIRGAEESSNETLLSFTWRYD